ncbi:serine/threonine protein kinase [Vermiconidia calcicola]|uniref:Serine/threonine protein kinase n=1 Tax=Vermiconidia calcicola TaxID=1690605 RepID=A0ACC3P177_9PEZI|nr:serine/threonine protein kinase [Vermiconidia calcicola]
MTHSAHAYPRHSLLTRGFAEADSAKKTVSSRPPNLQIPKNRAGNSSSNTTGNTPSARSGSSSSLAADAPRTIASVEGGKAEQEAYDTLTRSPILSPNTETGLRRIRQQPHPTQQPRKTSDTHLLPPTSGTSATSIPTPQLSPGPSRKSSLHHLTGPSSPSLPFGEDLTRFPSESLHSFSFAHQSSESLHNRQNVLKRSIDFMRDKLGWAASSPRIASAQARLTGDEDLLHMMELLQKVNTMSSEGGFGAAGLGIDRGPLTGPAHSAHENVFERSFVGQSPSGSSGSSASGVTVTEGTEEAGGSRNPTVSSPTSYEAPAGQADNEPVASSLQRTTTNEVLESLPPQRPHRASLKRTYTDTASYSLQHKLNEALAQPYHTNQSPSASSTTNAPSFRPPPPRSGTTVSDRAPHGHRNNQAQAIFTTAAEAPWTITAANDLACLVFGVTRAEVRKLGIMEVIDESRRKWLEEKLRNPEAGTAPRPAQQVKAAAAAAAAAAEGSGESKPAPAASLAGAMGGGITAKLLSKPPSRYSSAARRSKTVGHSHNPPPPPAPMVDATAQSDAATPLHHTPNKSRGVLLCGDVVPIRKMNGSTGTASLWVKEKGTGLIWVLEEIAEDVAFLTIDEIGSVIRGKGAVEAIWGLERVRRGMDVTRLIPNFPKLKGTNTGALDYDEVKRLKRFTARTSNSISIPVTVEDVDGESSTFRVSSFPHIAGILVLDPKTMQVSSSNSVFSSALFGYANPDGLPVSELIPEFDTILRVMTDEDQVELVDGIVIPEHSFRRARAVLALREGSATTAAEVFLRPSGLPARHRDGAEIMVDVQMRVVKSEPTYSSTPELSAIAEDDPREGSGLVYALWITYSRQLHAVNHGIGPVTPLVSRPGTPPQQPAPGSTRGGYVDSVVPSPMVGENPAEQDELRTKILTQQLEEAKALQDENASPDDSAPVTEQEPYEHPSPDMVEAGSKTTRKKKISDFSILEEMGQGAYGQVKLARYKKAIQAKKMVIKYVTKRRILVDTWHRDRRLGTVPLEIHVLDYLRRDGLQHPNIVEMADFFEDDVNYYIEMVPHGLPGMDLFDYIELRVTMEESECRKIFRQVAAALGHLHGVAKVVHRDIKDENVILDGEGRVKLVDFGSAAYIKSGPFDVFVGTIDYAAPEVLRGLPYRGKEQDVWALGILLYTIVYKENPFYSIDEIMDHDLRVPYVMSEACIDLIRKMLDRDVERRIGIEEVLNHEWCTVEDEETDDGERLAVMKAKGG